MITLGSKLTGEHLRTNKIDEFLAAWNQACSK
jgi:hypothetical protein